MDFSEAGNRWRPIPDWVRFLVGFGYHWMARRALARRLSLISMPADSAAAGLITLGLMRYCMELNDANDARDHFHRLVAIARTRPHDLTLHHVRLPRKRFHFDAFDSDGTLWVRQATYPQRRTIVPCTALDWRLDGEAPVALLAGTPLPNKLLYEQLVAECRPIIPANLATSHSTVCLAGRAEGERPTAESMRALRFREQHCEADLSQLLTIQGWLPGTVSRVRFYNTRTRTFDRGSGAPQVVVADGAASFLNLFTSAEFEDCDVIGVMHRTMDRGPLEAVGDKLSSLRQWYRPDDSLLGDLSDIPRGVTLAVLRRDR